MAKQSKARTAFGKDLDSLFGNTPMSVGSIISTSPNCGPCQTDDRPESMRIS